MTAPKAPCCPFMTGEMAVEGGREEGDAAESGEALKHRSKASLGSASTRPEEDALIGWVFWNLLEGGREGDRVWVWSGGRRGGELMKAVT